MKVSTFIIFIIKSVPLAFIIALPVGFIQYLHVKSKNKGDKTPRELYTMFSMSVGLLTIIFIALSLLIQVIKFM